MILLLDQDAWVRINKTCAGSYQSPINIAYPVKHNPRLYLKIEYTYPEDKEVIVENTGHTVQVSLSNDKHFQLTGSAANRDQFIFRQLHFHWGENDNDGAEHALFGQKYSGEAHFVFYNRKYRTFENAASQPDGLTVLGVFLKATRENNFALEPLISSLGSIRKEKSKSRALFDMSKILPDRLNEFFRYSGSLTTPPCAEVVNWIVFSNPIPIGRNQLKKFRNVRDEDGAKLLSTWRSLQSLNNRLIEASFNPK
ncbi:Carbonic anhydrase 7-like protein [Dinothrombium tinctorium]|uniref:carbonic anhydrase n=1 Tax=Dinothrombium tinctorium TaxID=1965070 RepID=A0A3S3PHI6_9ACAR|nr:Carbonic anhydrase 7-like protein [Dinothrombium tinctorium]